jgi:hypothetical protein
VLGREELADSRASVRPPAVGDRSQLVLGRKVVEATRAPPPFLRKIERHVVDWERQQTPEQAELGPTGSGTAIPFADRRARAILEALKP